MRNRTERKSLDVVVAQASTEDGFKVVTLEVKSIDGQGVFKGYAAVFDEPDRVDDVCLAGCFAESIAEWADRGTFPRLKWQHFNTIGHITLWREDPKGLYVEGRIWDEGVAEEIRKAVHGDPDDETYEAPGVGMSFAFVAITEEYVDGVRKLYRVAIMDDVTITLRPVQGTTGITEVKGGDGSEAFAMKRRLEGNLRDVGLSRREAKAMIAGGFDAMDGGTPSVGGGLSIIRDALASINP